MSKEDEELMLDNFVTFFIAGESVLFLPFMCEMRHKNKNKSPKCPLPPFVV